MGVGEDIRQLIARDGEVFLAPIAVRSPGAHSAKGEDFRLDYTRFVIQSLACRLDTFLLSCYRDQEHEWHHQRRSSTRRTPRRTSRSVPQPVCTMGYRYQTVLGGALTHLGSVRIALAFSVHGLIGLGCMINASGHLRDQWEHSVL
jgi:hypothetical protein